MKKISKLVSIALITSLAITGCGINKEITFKKNVLEDELLKPNIIQSTIDIKLDDSEVFMPIYYKDNEVRGIVNKNEDTMIGLGYPVSIEGKDKVYKLNNDKYLLETEDTTLVDSIFCIGEKSQRGIYSNIDRSEIYYYDRIRGLKTEVKINNIPDFNNEIEQFIMYGDNVKGNEDYCYVIQGVINKSDLDNLVEADFKNETLVLKNMKTSEEYILKDAEKIREIAGIIYDEETEKFYFIGYRGEIFEMLLSKEKIDLKEYGNIGVTTPNYLGTNNIHISKNGEFIISRYNSSKVFINYNLKTKTESYVENPFKGNGYIEAYFPKDNIVILRKESTVNPSNHEFYIGRVKLDSIEIYDKIEYKTKGFEIVQMAPAIINDDGTEIIITLMFSNIENTLDSQSMNYEYIKINIEGGKNE